MRPEESRRTSELAHHPPFSADSPPGSVQGLQRPEWHQILFCTVSISISSICIQTCIRYPERKKSTSVSIRFAFVRSVSARFHSNRSRREPRLPSLSLSQFASRLYPRLYPESTELFLQSFSESPALQFEVELQIAALSQTNFRKPMFQ